MDEILQITEALANGATEAELLQEHTVEAVNAAKANFSAQVPSSAYNNQYSVIDERAARTNTPEANQPVGISPNEELRKLNPLYSGSVQLGAGKDKYLPDSYAINPNTSNSQLSDTVPRPSEQRKQQPAIPDKNEISLDTLNKLQQQQQPQGGGLPGVGLRSPDYEAELKKYSDALEKHRLAVSANAATQESASQISEMATDYNKKIQEINQRENKILSDARKASMDAKKDYDDWLDEGKKLTGPSRKKAEDEFYGTGATGFFTRVLGAVAVSMGAYASNGGRNFAQEGIDRAIDQELEKQKAELALYESKGKRILNGWALAKERFGSDLAAESAFRAKAWNDVLDYKKQHFSDKLFSAEQKMKDAELELHGKQIMADTGIKIKQYAFDDKYKIAQLNLHREQIEQSKKQQGTEQQLKAIETIQKSFEHKKLHEIEGKLKQLQTLRYARKELLEKNNKTPIGAFFEKYAIPDVVREGLGTNTSSYDVIAENLAKSLVLYDTGVVNPMEAPSVVKMVGDSGTNGKAFETRMNLIERALLDRAAPIANPAIIYARKNGIPKETFMDGYDEIDKGLSKRHSSKNLESQDTGKRTPKLEQKKKAE